MISSPLLVDGDLQNIVDANEMFRPIPAVLLYALSLPRSVLQEVKGQTRLAALGKVSQHLIHPRSHVCRQETVAVQSTAKAGRSRDKCGTSRYKKDTKRSD